MSSVVAAGLALPAHSAQANSAYDVIRPSSWAYTDSRSHDALIRDDSGDAPVGSWRDADGKHHKSISYFTFDLTPLHGKRILSATGTLSETRANDCDVDRSVDVWLTEPVTDQNSWKEPPAQRTKLWSLSSTPYWCPASYLEFVVFEALRDAVAAAQPTMTVALRVPEALEGDVKRGRWFSNQMRLFFGYNTPPNVPSDLDVSYDGCEASAPGHWIPTAQPRLRARFSDPEVGSLTGHFAIWPVDRPELRTELTNRYAGNGNISSVTVPEGVLADGGTYAFAARAADDYDVSAWSEPCHFTVDVTRPAVAPVITGPPEYPEDKWSGAPGVSGTFTFAANGIADIVGYRYWLRGDGYGYVEADQLGGSASIVFTPEDGGPDTLTVVSVDRAGNRSPEARYDILVKENRPWMSVDTYPVEPGVPAEVTFHPRMDNLVSYTYRIENGPEQTLSAGADGTAATTLTFDEPGFYTVYFRSTDSSGYTTLENERSIWVQEPYEDPGDPF